ncbi:MAG: glycosyltransferase family 9 protein [Ardenticatenaceae bacterium]|nr:glycosyltransferase family 9 protein [Anaerolineales bacterium]MCB8920057.1 glycosyltransferase family 9 protein [Ardenticatenaceae bacterium]MCB8989902.1 glycosyltransferase family 9 protein [Ardenticatenaceae bacterium]
MLRETTLTTAAARLAHLFFDMRGRRSFTTPKKALILKPCCVSQVMLTTPLLAVLNEAYPDTQFDWAVSQWARPAVAGNPRITELIPAGEAGLSGANRSELRAFIERVRAEAYDTCIVPSRSSWLAYVAWRAGIPQRIGLDVNGRGFSHTMPIQPIPEVHHEAEIYLSLAYGLHIDPQLIVQRGRMEFYPPDQARTAVTARLVEEVDWLGDVPLAVLHPGGGHNPLVTDEQKRWPLTRFARLGNYLARRHGARVVLVGAKSDRTVATALAGMMSQPVTDLTGTVSLGEVGALCEVADLYVGNDAGPTHIAAATGCPTLAIFGPSDPRLSGPFAPQGRVISLASETAVSTPFTWDDGVSVEEAIAAADRLLAKETA